MRRWARWVWTYVAVHGCYHTWNPLYFVLRDDWMFQVWSFYGPFDWSWQKARARMLDLRPYVEV